MPDAAQLTDRIEPIDSLLGSEARHLFEQLAESSTAAQKAQLMDVFLRPLKAPDSGQKVLQHISIEGDSIEQAALATALSPRQLRRLCLDRAGVSPKFLSRILRFRKAVERINALCSNSAQPKWADLAALCGYYDQAHFIREFQEFTGHTPGRYLQSLRISRPYNRSHEPNTT
jgi:AraC-like DNA-binding protein